MGAGVKRRGSGDGFLDHHDLGFLDHLHEHLHEHGDHDDYVVDHFHHNRGGDRKGG